VGSGLARRVRASPDPYLRARPPRSRASRTSRPKARGKKGTRLGEGGPTAPLVAQVTARKEKMMRGERWMFLSKLPWVVAVYLVALLIMGIVVHFVGGHI
jgi:hypothetical protein